MMATFTPSIPAKSVRKVLRILARIPSSYESLAFQVLRMRQADDGVWIQLANADFRASVRIADAIDAFDPFDFLFTPQDAQHVAEVANSSGDVSFTLGNESMQVMSNIGRCTISYETSISPDELPIPREPNDPETIGIPGDDASSVLSTLVASMSRDDCRFQLTSVCASNGTLVSTNGKTLARYPLGGSPRGAGPRSTIPAKAMRAFAGLRSATSKTQSVTIQHDGKFFRLVSDRVEVVGICIDAVYPDYRSAIDDDYQDICTFSRRSDLLNAFRSFGAADAAHCPLVDRDGDALRLASVDHTMLVPATWTDGASPRLYLHPQMAKNAIPVGKGPLTFGYKDETHPVRFRLGNVETYWMPAVIKWKE